MREKYESLSLATLKELAKARGLKGISALRKPELIERMLEEDAYCTDIITQVSAVNAALNSFNKELLSTHIKTCVTDDIKAGKSRLAGL